jgi:ribosomal protein S18 acetylase RimI-like enzyme
MNVVTTTPLAAKARPGIRRASGSDVDHIARLFAASFMRDPVFDWMVKTGDGRLAALAAFFRWVLKSRTISAGETWMRPDGVAAAAWIPPGVADSPAFFIDQLRLTPLMMSLTGVGRMSRGVALAGAMDDHPSEPHYYLAFIGVAPNRQRHGMGTALMEESLARVDRAGAPAYLENSNARNLPFYQRLGFRVIKEVRARPEAPPLFAMWRPAAARRKSEATSPKSDKKKS